MAGIFLCLEGVDGAGKSTQLRALRERLEREGRDVVWCRDPGGTPAGDEIRRILLGGEFPLAMKTEMLLYMASRAQLVEEVIAPALAEGRAVVSDRFLLSTIVYQGHAGGLDPEEIRRVGWIATGGVLPDRTILLDLDPRKAAARRTGAADRIERRPEPYHARVRAGFLYEARHDPEHIVVIDASGDVDSVHQAVHAEVARALDPPRT